MNPADQVKEEFKAIINHGLEIYIKDMDDELKQGSSTIPSWETARIADHLENFSDFLADEKEVLSRKEMEKEWEALKPSIRVGVENNHRWRHSNRTNRTNPRCFLCVKEFNVTPNLKLPLMHNIEVQNGD